MLGIRWQHRPYDSGAYLVGGRWNALGTPALYLSADVSTAVVEMHQTVIRPGTLVAFDVKASRIADLRDIEPAIGLADWRATHRQGGDTPPSWKVADDLIAAGAEGALVPSVQNRGATNLVLWRWHDTAVGGEGAALTLLDPDAALGGRA